MRKHLLLSFAAAVLGCVAAHANVIEPAAALQRAVESGGPVSATRASAFALESTIQTSTGPALYLFSDGAKSLVVSADDQTPALVGYLDNMPAKEMMHAPGFSYWMGEYAAQIDWLRANPRLGTRAGSSHRTATRAAITPMVQTKWNQDAPYNDLCPLDNGKRSVTGCVATAMSQAINFHQWPVKGIGSHSYQTLGQTLTFDYAGTTFEWDQMADTYGSKSTPEQKKAVATLMYACGVAVNMDYTSDESGAVSEIIPQVLIEYFNYDKGVHNVIRDVTTQEIWDQTVYDELAQGRPVIYSGTSNEGGHCFVCDGYSDGYFHINWGWGGLDDGYFLLSVLDPGDVEGIGGSVGAFAYDQVIVAGMKKPVSGSTVEQVLVMPNGFSISDQTVSQGATLTLKGAVVNYSAAKVSGHFGLMAVSENGQTYTSQGAGYSNFGVLYQVNSYEAPLPSNLPQGQYTLYPAYCPQGGDWQKIEVQNGCVGYYSMQVSSGGITLAAQEVPSVTISDLKVSSPVFIGKYIQVSGTVANTSSLDFSGVAQLVVVDQSGNEVAAGYRVELSLEAGAQQSFSYSSEIQDASGGTLDAGQYQAAFIDPETGAMLSDSFSIDLQDAPTTQVQAEDLAYSGNAQAADKSALAFSATVGCVEGYLAEPLTLLIANQSGEGLATIQSAPVFLSEGNQQTVDFTGSFPHGEPGTTYLACIFYGNTQITNPIQFTLSTSGVDTLQDGDRVLSMEAYTLTGVKVAANENGEVDTTLLSPGVYVLRAVTPQGVKTVKIAVK